MADRDFGYDDLDPVQETVTRCTLPDDAQRLGLDRNTEQGALLAMVGALNPDRFWHKVVA